MQPQKIFFFFTLFSHPRLLLRTRENCGILKSPFHKVKGQKREKFDFESSSFFTRRINDAMLTMFLNSSPFTILVSYLFDDIHRKRHFVAQFVWHFNYSTLFNKLICFKRWNVRLLRKVVSNIEHTITHSVNHVSTTEISNV